MTSAIQEKLAETLQISMERAKEFWIFAIS